MKKLRLQTECFGYMVLDIEEWLFVSFVIFCSDPFFFPVCSGGLHQGNKDNEESVAFATGFPWRLCVFRDFAFSLFSRPLRLGARILE
jgi:hypothetical protein